MATQTHINLYFFISIKVNMLLINNLLISKQPIGFLKSLGLQAVRVQVPLWAPNISLLTSTLVN
ncbi:hypothetical protein XNA1_3820006 [Xenorhabdus nematophila str. Anatoliense]|nr:hypothetical protein XNA1_3820006 [Xenorhabdus nematophila str. Anatoliense]